MNVYFFSLFLKFAYTFKYNEKTSLSILMLNKMIRFKKEIVVNIKNDKNHINHTDFQKTR
ncbi:hypothetical protein BSM4216_0922 [Bacillus smithii]|nr:hypothetical protein BSM4216_0922 [Bacillus smithii]